MSCKFHLEWCPGDIVDRDGVSLSLTGAEVVGCRRQGETDNPRRNNQPSGEVVLPSFLLPAHSLTGVLYEWHTTVSTIRGHSDTGTEEKYQTA